MNRTAYRKGCNFAIALLLIAATSGPALAVEQDTIGGSTGGGTAADDGDGDWRAVLPEQFWYFEPDVRTRMMQDPDVVPMYEAAIKAKHQRRTAGMVLYFIGAPIMAGSFVLFVAPEDLGFDADIADVVSISGAAVGAGTIVTAALLRALDTPAEKRFKQYMRDRYDVIPVVNLPHVRPDGTVAWNVIEFQF